MFVERYLHPANELGKLINVGQYLSRYASVIHSAKVFVTTYQLNCLAEYIIVGIKENIFSHDKTFLNRKSRFLKF
jgi:hypothetical protein